MSFLAVITLLLVYQLCGELIVHSTGMRVPGPVLGMLMLLFSLLLYRPLATQIRLPSEQLLSHLSLLFIPAGVGIMLHVARLHQEGLAIMTALLISTVLGLMVTALSMQLLLKWANKRARS
jgi:holin-like protein